MRGGLGGAGAKRFLRPCLGEPTVLEQGVDPLELGSVSVEGNSSLTVGGGGAGALRFLRERMVPPAELVSELLEPRASELRCSELAPSELMLP